MTTSMFGAKVAPVARFFVFYYARAREGSYDVGNISTCTLSVITRAHVKGVSLRRYAKGT